LQGVRLQDAIASAKKAFRLAPVPQYLQTLALAHFQAGAHQEALKAIRTAIEMEPENDAFRRTLVKMKEADEKTK
jgi:tetratricopeptide (TPR) repeat protein